MWEGWRVANFKCNRILEATTLFSVTHEVYCRSRFWNVTATISLQVKSTHEYKPQTHLAAFYVNLMCYYLFEMLLIKSNFLQRYARYFFQLNNYFGVKMNDSNGTKSKAKHEANQKRNRLATSSFQPLQWGKITLVVIVKEKPNAYL